MKRLSRNFFSLLISDIARRFFGFLAVAYLARTVGVYGFGAVSLALTILSYIIMISSAGMHILGMREIAREDSRDLVGEILGARIMNSVILFVVLFVVCLLLLKDDVLVRLTLITCSSVFFQSLFLDWYFQGKEEMVAIGGARTASAIAYLVLLFIFVRSVNDIMYVGAASAAGDFLAVLLMWQVYRRTSGELRVSFDLKRWEALMRRALPLGIGSILAHLSINIPPIALGIVLTTAHVGLYSAASKLVFFLLMIDRIFAALLLPASVRLHSMSKEALSSALVTTLKWITVIGFPLGVGGMMLSEKIFVVVFGSTYLEAAGVFRVLVWYFFVTMVHTVYMSGLIAVGREKTFRNVMAVSAALYFSLSFVLAKFYGPVGVATAVVLSEAITVIIMKLKLQVSLYLGPTQFVPRVLTASFVMAVGLVVFENLHLIAAVSLGASLYGLVVLASRAVTMEEILALGRRMT